MKRVFKHDRQVYVIEPHDAVRLTDEQTNSLLKTLLDHPEDTFVTTGDTMVTIAGDRIYICTIRESADLVGEV